MVKRNDKGKWDLEPQKSSAAQFLTYIASTGASDEKFEIRYEDENIWMSQKMLAAVYGVEVPNIAYHLRRLFSDAELDKAAVIKEILITAEDGKRYNVNHYNLQVIIALGFKIDNERAIAFRKWANQIVSEYTIKGWVMDVPRLKDGSPITDKYFEHQLKRMVNAFLDDAETQTMKKIPLTMEDWKTRLDRFLVLFDQNALKYDGDPITAYQAQLYAESEFEKYRIVQDRLFMSDYDRYLLELEDEIKKGKGGKNGAEGEGK